MGNLNRELLTYAYRGHELSILGEHTMCDPKLMMSLDYIYGFKVFNRPDMKSRCYSQFPCSNYAFWWMDLQACYLMCMTTVESLCVLGEILDDGDLWDEVDAKSLAIFVMGGESCLFDIWIDHLFAKEFWD